MATIASPPRTRRPVLLIGIGAAALSLALVVVTLADQVGPEVLMDHVRELYGPYGRTPSAGLQYGLLYGVAAVNLLVWSGVALAARARSKWLASGSIATAAVLTMAVGVTLLVAREYGERIFPLQWGVVALLPLLAPAIGLLRSPGARRG